MRELAILGIPDGIQDLISRSARRRFRFAILGFIVISLLDTAGVLAMVPLMQLIAGSPPNQGALGLLRRLLGSPSNSTLLSITTGVVVGAFIVKGSISIVFRRWQVHFIAAQETALGTVMLEKFLRAPYAWHLNRNPADMMWTVEQGVALGFTTSLVAALSALSESATISAVLVTLAVFSPLPTAFALIFFGASGYVIQRILRERQRVMSERNVRASISSGRAIHHAFGAVKEIKIRHAEQNFLDPYEEARDLGAHARASSSLYAEAPKYVLEIVFVFGIALMTLLVGTVGGSTNAVVTLGVFVAAGSRVLPSTVRLLASLSAIRLGRSPLTHLIDEYRQLDESEKKAKLRAVTDRIPTGDLRIRDLHFFYDGHADNPVLNGVNADISKGRSVALVGASGAGKSTLVDLILGLHAPSSGSIQAGQVEINDNLLGWQRRLAVVPQDVYLLDASLRSNIILDVALDEAQLDQVLERSQLRDLIIALPQGLDTEVGERGVRLSGGQRQRIGIARALYRQPEVLILDEATSALDNETERRLTETIHGLKGSMTMIIVAHRLSTVRDCDEVLYMSAGLVVSRGSFTEVARDNAEFAHLVELGSLRRSED